MQFEIWAARGLRLAIDGVEPALRGWSVDELDNGWGISGEPLMINGRYLSRIEMDKSRTAVIESCDDPTTITLTFVNADGSTQEAVKLSVVMTACDRYVTTVSGGVESIDEATYYVRASTESTELKDPVDEIANWTVTIKFPWMRKREVIEALQGGLDGTDYEIVKE